MWVKDEVLVGLVGMYEGKGKRDSGVCAGHTQVLLVVINFYTLQMSRSSVTMFTASRFDDEACEFAESFSSPDTR